MSDCIIKREPRIIWADIAKGIGIIFVIMGHTPIPCYISQYLGMPDFLQNWIYAFHMPLFFLISGFLTNWKYSYSSFVIRKAKSLLFYYIIYSIINIFLTCGNIQFTYILKHGWDGIALWFLPILFLSLIVAKLFSDKFILLGIFMMLLTSWLFAVNDIHISWSLSSLPYATTWVLIGRISTKYINEILQWSYTKHTISSLCFLSIVSIIAYFWRLDICSNQILPLIPLIASGISGSILIIIFSTHLTQITLLSNFFSHIGRSSLEIMAFHQIILYFIPLPIFVRILLLPTIIIFVVLLKKNFLEKICRTTKSHKKNGLTSGGIE